MKFFFLKTIFVPIMQETDECYHPLICWLLLKLLKFYSKFALSAMCFNDRINGFIKRLTFRRKKYTNICEKSPLLPSKIYRLLIGLILTYITLYLLNTAPAKISELKEIDTVSFCEIILIFKKRRLVLISFYPHRLNCFNLYSLRKEHLIIKKIRFF